MLRAYISRDNLRHNAAVLKSRCEAGTKLCVEVKADAYGHHAKLVVPCLVDLADMFAVASIEEAEEIYPLLQNFRDKPILVHRPLFAGMDVRQIELARTRGFHCTICSREGLRYAREGLRYAAEQLDGSLPALNVHLQIDTGMGRLGCPDQDALMLLQLIEQDKNFCLRGVYTHFAAADEDDLSFTYEQLGLFQNFLADSGLDQHNDILKHTANTSATLRVPQAHFDMVRCGIGIYGYRDFINGVAEPVNLLPALRIEATLIQVKNLKAGHSCGYGRAFIAPRDMTIGIVSVGYNDGLLRSLSNRAVFRYGKLYLPIIGRVSMDLTIIDLSLVNNPAEGMKVIVIDDQPDSLCNAAALAKQADTIPNEILTSVGNRVKRELI
ncbi:MAG: alanine racemase [Sedimentisphaerales bacterium]|nr:alanine racemase [Sedimentisphaerales bacterium]